MSVRIKWNLNPKMQIEIDCASIKDAFKELSAYSVLQIYECGHCKHAPVTPTHRVAEGYDFYEMQCPSCGYRFSFGQHKEGDTLFPKRQKGWHHWKDEDHGEVDQSGPTVDEFSQNGQVVESVDEF